MSIPKKKNFDLVSVKNLNDVKILKRVKEMLLFIFARYGVL